MYFCKNQIYLFLVVLKWLESSYYSRQKELKNYIEIKNKLFLYLILVGSVTGIKNF